MPATTDSPRDPVSVARKTPAIAERIAKLKGASAGLYNDQAGAQLDEKVTVIELDGQCGFAGCSSTSLVVFTYRTRGANTATSSVMAMVSCPPIMQKGCTAAVAEVRPKDSSNKPAGENAPSRTQVVEPLSTPFRFSASLFVAGVPGPWTHVVVRTLEQAGWDGVVYLPTVNLSSVADSGKRSELVRWRDETLRHSDGVLIWLGDGGKRTTRGF